MQTRTNSLERKSCSINTIYFIRNDEVYQLANEELCFFNEVTKIAIVHTKYIGTAKYIVDHERFREKSYGMKLEDVQSKYNVYQERLDDERTYTLFLKNQQEFSNLMNSL